MTNKRDWPQWLRDAETENAIVTIEEGGRVIWYSGVWHGGAWHGGDWYSGVWLDGAWHGGAWHDGVWHDGVWRDGVWHGGDWHIGDWHDGDWRGGDWYSGDWHDGVWHGGDWYSGAWHDGVWHGGVWRGGVWHGGDDNPTRCMFHVRGGGDTIKVGCKAYTVAEARALCDGGDLPAEAPSRDSDAGRLLRASVLAQIAWQEALK